MRIGKVAQLSNTTASTIRYYERIGILPKTTRQAGQRIYDETILEQLGAIKIARNLKFNLEEIKILMETFRVSAAPSDECRHLTEQKLQEIDQVIAEAQAMKRILEHGISCDCTSLQGCYLQESELTAC